MTIDRDRAQKAMAEFLVALGHDREELRETPARVTAAYADELLSGYAVDVPRLLREGSDVLDGPADAVALDRIATSTVCPHHLLVAEGTTLVAYQPGSRVMGLGTLSRLVAACSRRLVLQEEIAGRVVDALMEHGGARGAFCRVTLQHACLRSRGAREANAETVTWASRGTFCEVRLLEIVLGRLSSEEA